MVFIGYHASHEQLAPSTLLECVIDAEQVGFDGAFSADHLAPWTPQQGHSGNTIAWLGAALARTSFGIGSVVTPGYRYHPVVAAHAVATLTEMFPGRYFPALGSGEFLNEHMVGCRWPDKDERTARLGECVDIMRELLAGEEVTHDGRVTASRARLWTLPEAPPPLLATATSAQTAAWAAEWSDGLVTVGTTAGELVEVVEAYRGAGGRGDVCLQVHFAFADTEDEALSVVRDQWLHGVVTPPQAWDVPQPEDFVRLAGTPTDEELSRHVVVATEVDTLADHLSELAAVGFDRLYLHEVSQDQNRFLRALAPDLLPELRARWEERR